MCKQALYPYLANNDYGPLMPWIFSTWAAAAMVGAWGFVKRDWRRPTGPNLHTSRPVPVH